MARTVVGYFRDRASADAAYNDLQQRGYSRDDISIVGRGREGGGLHDDDDHVSAGEGVAIGGIAGLLLGAAAMLIPGIGPLVAVGPISAALAGAVTGGVTGAVVGGITGALIDAGVEEDEARYYDERIKQGGYLVTVRADNGQEADARAILQRHGADMRGPSTETTTTTDTRTTGARPAAAMDTARTGDTDRRAEGEQRVQLREERLVADKEAVQAGEVRVGKEVVTEQRTIDVPVTREEVVIERHRVEGGRPASGPIGTGSEEIRVPVREEEVRAEKETVVTEEIEVGKRAVQETERVSGTVRREEARIEREGDVNVRGDATDRTMPGGSVPPRDADRR